ncbi:SDR family NAD(P)-dependent oxidoreductase [Sulfitobacter sp. F26204]|uniref:SDR family NAD(P)-dependent oxidoreductase n=1 Tax=Sulfitobacter sp. F26204 TaxID=2996014 RepID=UPI00225E3F14|nr:SDR family NAD(P)-dependent oxidoreductase [Sulfitobacter sp. F26204]MCX7561142.1 SDR family NAD(P)-dependent oxidoreductase [Sulfitobacter sp. F26204]
MHEGRTTWIIGASEGIGAALARDWARRGTRMILSARGSGRLNELATELGPDHVAISMDVGDRSSVDTAVAKIAGLGPLDRIVHLAALYDPGKIADLDPDTAAQIVTVNLMGCFHIAQTAPGLLRRGGQLAFCGSVAGYIGLPQGQIYSASKAGVINLVESLRAELAGQIDVRLISPGFVDTRLTQRNDFNMPAMVSPEIAAQRIIAGLDGRRFEVHFPRRLTLLLKLLQTLPYWATLPLTGRLTK